MPALFTKNIGEYYAYGTTYSGPIGSGISPHLRGMEEFKHLSYASSLCGNGTEVCAVKINLHEILLENRKESVDRVLHHSVKKMASEDLENRFTLQRGHRANMGKNFKVVNGMFKVWKEKPQRFAL